MMNSPKIKNITPLSGTHRLHVEWENDTESIVDFRLSIKRSKLLAPLKDFELFSKVAILEDGWVIGWPGNIDYAADNLWQAYQFPAARQRE